MPRTLVGAIFATKSKLLQSIYIPDKDDGEIDLVKINPGETLIKLPIAIFQDGGPVAVQEAVGQPTFSGRCAVVHKKDNAVIDVIIADPDVYHHPDGHHVIPHDNAIHGDKWDGKKFNRKYAELDYKSGKCIGIAYQPIDAFRVTEPGNYLSASPDDMTIGAIHLPSHKIGNPSLLK